PSPLLNSMPTFSLKKTNRQVKDKQGRISSRETKKEHETRTHFLVWALGLWLEPVQFLQDFYHEEMLDFIKDTKGNGPDPQACQKQQRYKVIEFMSTLQSASHPLPFGKPIPSSCSRAVGTLCSACLPRVHRVCSQSVYPVLSQLLRNGVFCTRGRNTTFVVLFFSALSFVEIRLPS
ncbi:RIKEN cDNA E230016K23, partial [Mus musculus]